MKKTIVGISIFVIVLLLLQIGSMAAGSIAPSPRSLSITTGSSASFTITASNACGRVDIYSSNPSVASVNMSSQWVENNSVTVTVSGISAGSTSVVVKLSDAATFDEEELTGSYTVNVTVSDPVVNTQTPAATPTPTPTTTNVNTPKLSTNNKLSLLSVEGYELTKKDENTYELVVTNNIDKLTVNATAEDEKATIEGAGERTIEIGANALEVIVTSESKAQNKYTINVTRKDAFYLEDLNYAVDVLEDTVIDIKLLKDDVITTEHLQKVKESGKTINFNYYDENGTNLYTWIIDGTQINTINDVKTNVIFSSEYEEQIQSLSNYASGIYMKLEQTEELPEGTKLKIYVGDRYKDGDTVYIYTYNKETNILEKVTGVVVTGGYIEIDIKANEDYFITKADIILETEDGCKFNILIIIIIIEAIIIITLLILDYNNANPISKIKKKKD